MEYMGNRFINRCVSEYGFYLHMGSSCFTAKASFVVIEASCLVGKVTTYSLKTTILRYYGKRGARTNPLEPPLCTGLCTVTAFNFILNYIHSEKICMFWSPIKIY